MSSTIDRSKAPVGTTHYCTAHDLKNVRTFAWHKKENGVWSFYGVNGWSPYACKFPGEFDVLIEHPTESPAWNGEGLPPVGTVCEVHYQNKTWRECEVVAHKTADDCVMAVAWIDANTLDQSAGVRFRPIRTPEQVATETRESTIDEMVDVWRRTMGRFALEERGLAEMLYDAGYRKVEQP